jgi:hypothetical protein
VRGHEPNRPQPKRDHHPRTTSRRNATPGRTPPRPYHLNYPKDITYLLCYYLPLKFKEPHMKALSASIFFLAVALLIVNFGFQRHERNHRQQFLTRASTSPDLELQAINHAAEDAKNEIAASPQDNGGATSVELRQHDIDLFKTRFQQQLPKPKPATAPQTTSTAPTSSDSSSTELIVRIVISAILLLVSLYISVVSSRNDPAEKHFAYGTVGTIIGFWLQS